MIRFVTSPLTHTTTLIYNDYHLFDKNMYGEKLGSMGALIGLAHLSWIRTHGCAVWPWTQLHLRPWEVVNAVE